MDGGSSQVYLRARGRPCTSVRARPGPARTSFITTNLSPPRQGYHLAHPWCPMARAPGLERLSPSRVVAHHNAYDGCLVAPSRTSRETSVDGTLPWTAHCESLTSVAPGYCHAASTAVTDRLTAVEKDALCLPRGGPHSLTAACRTTITNPGLRATN